MGKRTGLSPARKIEAVMKLLRREEPAAKIARRYSISEQTLYRYRDIFLESGKSGLANGKGKTTEDGQIRHLKQELADRDQVINELTIANRLLKKISEGSL